MNLLDILSDNYIVCRDKLLSFVDLNDLLRLRMVSKPFKYVAEDYIRTKKVKTGRSLIIDWASNRPFEQHFEFYGTSSVLPLRERLEMYNFNVRRDKSKLSMKQRQLQGFLETSDSSNITTLYLFINGFNVSRDSKTILWLLDSFPNVIDLELCIRMDNDEEEEDASSSGPKEISIPTGFKNLLRLRLKPLLVQTATPTARQNFIRYVSKLVQANISNLERLFFHIANLVGDSDEELERAVRFACMCLFSEHDMKLEWMGGSFIEELLEPDVRTPEMGTIEDMASRINAKVVSIFNPDITTFFLELPNLEKLNVEHSSISMIPNPIRPEWPKLAELQVHFENIDASEDGCDWDGTPSLPMLWEFLFVGIERKNLVELHIGFDFDGVYEPNIIYSGTTDIVASCPNLKILRLDTQIKQLIFLPELWKGLPHLEELYISFFAPCSDLSDVDFVGEDESSPVFWNLKSLKVLYLSSLESMEVTDKLFIKVLAHMPLKKLRVHSNAYVDSITLDGIKGLLDGKFATTIEWFSLQLAGVSTEEQDAVKKLFRSSQMI